MIIDAHVHLWRRVDGHAWLDNDRMAPIRRDYASADLATELTANGVDRATLVESGLRCYSETAALQELADVTASIAGVVGWASFRSDFPISDLKRSRKLVGLRDQLDAHHPMVLDEPDVRQRLAEIAAEDLAIDLLVRIDQLPAAARAAAALPHARFVLDHLAKPPIASGGWQPWRDHLAVLAAQPNVTAKLSGLVTEAAPDWTDAQLEPYVSAALQLFGPDRLLWGSDWPVCQLAGGYARWHAAARRLIPTDAHAAVFGGNAATIYRLD